MTNNREGRLEDDVMPSNYDDHGALAAKTLERLQVVAMTDQAPVAKEWAVSQYEVFHEGQRESRYSVSEFEVGKAAVLRQVCLCTDPELAQQIASEHNRLPKLEAELRSRRNLWRRKFVEAVEKLVANGF